MRLNAFILALCVCVYHTRAASINVPETKLDALDDVDLDNVEQETVLNKQNQKKTNDDIPVKVEQAVNENSNDYVPDNDDSNINVKRIEVDLRNPGPPQRQEHETQNPDSYSEREKAIFAIKSTIANAEKVFDEGFQDVSNGLKSIFSPEENLPVIQRSINNLKETFTGEIEKMNYAIKAQLKPETVPSGQTSENIVEIAELRLKVLEKNFVTGVDALSEGVELYSIIKEDEAGKTAAVRADIQNSEESQPSSSSPAPTQPNLIMTCLGEMMANSFNTISLTLSNGLNLNTNNSNSPSNFMECIFQNQTSQSQTQASKPPNVQSDTPEQQQLSPNLFQAASNHVQTVINNTQQAFQNNSMQQILNFFFGGTTQATSNTDATTKQPDHQSSSKKPDDEVQSDNTVPARSPAVAPLQAPVSQPIQQVQTAQAPVPLQPGPIQQLIQNNPIIKGLQSTVQRLQGVPNPETPREEVVQDKISNEDGNVDSKGHYGGNNNVNNVNQGGTDDSGRIEEKIEEVKAQNIPSAEDITEEKISAEQLKTPAVSDKTE